LLALQPALLIIAVYLAKMETTERTIQILKLSDSKARRQCRLARDFERAGEYEAARSALTGIWSTLGERPVIENLHADTQAEVLLRVGALSGWLGSARQINGAQEIALDLIGESIRRFESLANHDKVAEAQTDLSICYWRLGAFDEGRVFVQQALANAGHPETRLRALVNGSLVEISSGQFDQALGLLDDASKLLNQVPDEGARGRYYLQRALVYRKIGGPENLDRALIEYSAASMHLSNAGDTRYLAAVENNIGFLLVRAGHYAEAIPHLDKAREIFVTLKDTGNVAQVNETRAQAFIAERRYAEAERAAFAAVTTLERGDEHALLADALSTYARALTGLGKWEAARDAFLRASTALGNAGDLQAAANIYLVLIEELQSWLPLDQTLQLLIEADDRLGSELDRETIARLRRCNRIAVSSAREHKASIDGFLLGGSLDQEVKHFEAQLIKRALDQANGSVTRAARLLNITHQGLAWSLQNKHQHLLRARTPVRPRRKSIMFKQ
jgi:tetratricopeptide (TPR) repeat protein